MLSPEPLSQAYFGDVDDPATECHCNLWDWDQLRLIKVKFFSPEDDAETSIFARYWHYLSPEVRQITIDKDGLLTGISTDPDIDETEFTAYMPFSFCEHLANCPKIYFSQLCLSPKWDICRCAGSTTNDNASNTSMYHKSQQGRDLDHLRWSKHWKVHYFPRGFCLRVHIPGTRTQRYVTAFDVPCSFPILHTLCRKHLAKMTNPYKADPENIPMTDLYADVPFYGPICRENKRIASRNKLGGYSVNFTRTSQMTTLKLALTSYQTPTYSATVESIP
ncbi:hypothetical protein N7488_004240 [Penicillium malachiteum]|nr:hypothetical protein N7488_004240 [Penicillium malachiteum]